MKGRFCDSLFARSEFFVSQALSTEVACFAGILFHEVVSFFHAATFRGESATSFRDGAESAAINVSAAGA
jgi:hypothetical protein